MNSKRILKPKAILKAVFPILFIPLVVSLSCCKKSSPPASVSTNQTCRLQSITLQGNLFENINYDAQETILSVEFKNNAMASMVPVYTGNKLDSVICYGSAYGSYVYVPDTLGRLGAIDRNTNEAADYNTSIFYYRGASLKPWQEKQTFWIQSTGNSRLVRTLNYTFDGRGNIQTCTDLSAGTVDSFQYDNVQNFNKGLEFVGHTLACWNPNNMTSDISYDKYGNLLSKTVYEYEYESGKVSQEKVINNAGLSSIYSLSYKCN